MPQRRRIAVPTGLIAPALLIVAAMTGTASLSACEIEVAPDAIPVPFSVAPVPSASVGRPAYVCTAVYKILTDGAVRLAGYTTEERELRDAFADMSADVSAAGATSTDAAQREKVAAIAATLDEGAQSADPKAFLSQDFPTIGQDLDGTCT